MRKNLGSDENNIHFGKGRSFPKLALALNFFGFGPSGFNTTGDRPFTFDKVRYGK